MHAGDIDALLHIFADPIVMASFDAVPLDRQQMEQWLQRNLDHQDRFGYGLFAVILKANGLLVGDCGLEIMEVDGTIEAELGYDFRSDYWGQGLATEAAIAIRDYAFQVLHLPRLVSLIRRRNLASQRVAEKVGLRRITAITRYGQSYWIYALSPEEAEHQT
jgi:RimJ/RimL family protein N-acetyltransferase